MKTQVIATLTTALYIPMKTTILFGLTMLNIVSILVIQNVPAVGADPDK